MKNNKGFTLIELLAVIVVLAIIALIAVPVVLNIIEQARKGAAESSARSYMKATETYVISSELNKKDTLLKNNKYNVTKTTTIGDKTYQAINDLVEIKGTKPNGSEDYITLGDNYQVIEAKLTINGYEILIKNDEVISIVKGKIVEVESITIDKTNENIEIGSTLQLNASVTPSNATNKTVTWTSSDGSIATVDSNGLVKGVKAGSVTITATTSNEKTTTANITIASTNLANVVNIGDYIAYDAGTWTSSAPLPTNQGEFGGYTSGENKANSTGACYSSYATTLKGWRVLSVDKNTNTITIIHAGTPECYFHAYGYSDASITNLNNRATSEYLNYTYASNAHSMNYDEALAITGSTNSTTNNLRNIGAYYWLANPSGDVNDGLWNVFNDGFIHIRGTYSFGVRPVVVLKPNIKTTGKTTDAVGQEAWSLVAP